MASCIVDPRTTETKRRDLLRRLTPFHIIFCLDLKPLLNPVDSYSLLKLSQPPKCDQVPSASATCCNTDSSVVRCDIRLCAIHRSAKLHVGWSPLPTDPTSLLLSRLYSLLRAFARSILLIMSMMPRPTFIAAVTRITTIRTHTIHTLSEGADDKLLAISYSFLPILHLYILHSIHRISSES